MDAQPATARETEPVLSVRNLIKKFGAVTALDDVTLNIQAGEVLGIVGDNGAGKSTLLSVLSGYHHPDSGEFYYRGNRVKMTSPARSRRELGIEMVYQDLAMAPDLAVWQNLFLGEELRRWRLFLDRSAMRARARDALARMQTKIAPDDLVSDLSGGERQLVAVARGVLFDRDIILLDEPTAAISAAKSDDVLDTIRSLHAQGKTVLLISHRLDDILAVCTRIAILVTGRLAHVVSNDGLSIEDLTRMVFAGRPGMPKRNES